VSQLQWKFAKYGQILPTLPLTQRTICAITAVSLSIIIMLITGAYFTLAHKQTWQVGVLPLTDVCLLQTII